MGGQKAKPRCFNPTGVRLKRGEARRRGAVPARLQSHRGSSETASASARLPSSSWLQSHRGSSETPHRRGGHGADQCFNPTGVRLKPSRRSHGPFGADRFNPTGVRLKRIVDGEERAASIGFNPTGVRLKPAAVRTGIAIYPEISQRNFHRPSIHSQSPGGRWNRRRTRSHPTSGKPASWLVGVTERLVLEGCGIL